MVRLPWKRGSQLRKGRSMRSLVLLGNVLLATIFTMPGCGKGRPPAPLGQVPPGPAIGTLAPEIEGVDLDGQAFKLSDYRGKVVLLDFWGQFCPPCRDFFPHERSLVDHYSGRPFVLLGVNNDLDINVARQSVAKNKLNWRSWFDGGRPGPIAKQFDLDGWPTVYLIDAKGIVRYYCCPIRSPAELEEVLETLVKEAERKS